MGVAAKLVSDFCKLTDDAQKNALIIPQNIQDPNPSILGENSDCFKEYINLSKKEEVINAFPKIQTHHKKNKELNAGNLVFSAFLSLIGLIFILSA